MRLSVPIFLFAVLAAIGAGFGVSQVLGSATTEKLKADLDEARDCRHTGATLPPCPVKYQSTKIEWRDKVETVEAPDPRQTRRIATLSAELADARDRLQGFERRRAMARAPRLTGAWWVQNGTISRPFSADDRCPSGTVVVYEANAPVRGAANIRSGDPNVCYVVAMRDRRFASGQD